MTQDITQLPWVLHKESNCIKSNFDRPDDMVAMPPFEELESHENWEANAAFIVRACNNHKALLNALRSGEKTFLQSLGIIVEFGDLNGFRNLSDEDLGKAVKINAIKLSETIDELRAAIANAEKE